jgi:hypothetical protein
MAAARQNRMAAERHGRTSRRRGVVAVAGARLACTFEDPALTTWEAEER